MTLTHLPMDRESIKTQAVLIDKWRWQEFQSSLLMVGDIFDKNSIRIDGKELHFLKSDIGVFIIVYIK